MNDCHQTVNLQIPGKTFLVGEYCALKGGPSLIFCSKPFFNAAFNKTIKNESPSFHPESPAGQFIHQVCRLHEQHHRAREMGQYLNACQFKNPYHPPGGLGASTAEFLAVYQAWLKEHNCPLNLDVLLKDYLSLFKDKATKPSGADLVAQAMGGLVIQEPDTKKRESLDWPFEHLSLLLMHTGVKLATHEHLKKFSTPNEFDELKDIAKEAISAIKNKEEEAFAQSINDCRAALDNLNLVANHTKVLLEQLNKHPKTIATKGCGAMGSDVIALLCRPQDKATLLGFSQSLNLSLIATELEMASCHQE